MALNEEQKKQLAKLASDIKKMNKQAKEIKKNS